MTRDILRPPIETVLADEHIVAFGVVKDGAITVFVERLISAQAKLDAAFPDGRIEGIRIDLRDAGATIRDRWSAV